ncbi:tetratricopeptide repeat protein [[Phormidium] sp. ETS-05]|uniref:tetratricopeptide repeat protein n=1 Tax=[Phormidium] sp. ETS-05 TaxID=222819 RepID=UPI0035C8ED64
MDKRGKCLFLLGRYAEAISSFDKALALQPDDSAMNGRQQAIDALKAGKGMF